MTVIPLFPPGVHDIVAEEGDDGVTRITCSAGDWLTVHARTPEEIRWARLSGYDHAARHRQGLCHDACLDTEGCLYEGTDG